MSKRDRVILGGLVPLILVGAFWLLLLHPKLGHLHQADADLTAARTQLVQANGDLAVQRAASARYAKERKALAEASVAVPGGPATPPLLRQLEKTADKAGVDLTSVTPGVASPGASAPSGVPAPADVTPVSLSLAYSGTYAHSQAFLRALSKLSKVKGGNVRATGRLISLGTVNMSTGGSDGSLNVTATGAYYTLAPPTPAADATGAPTAGTTP